MIRLLPLHFLNHGKEEAERSDANDSVTEETLGERDINRKKEREKDTEFCVTFYEQFKGLDYVLEIWKVFRMKRNREKEKKKKGERERERRREKMRERESGSKIKYLFKHEEIFEIIKCCF